MLLADAKLSSADFTSVGGENCFVLDCGRGASCDCCMTNDTGGKPEAENQRRYRWPWLVLAAVLLAIALAVLWLSKEIERARRIRDLNAPVPRTDRGATSWVAAAPAAAWRL